MPGRAHELAMACPLWEGMGAAQLSLDPNPGSDEIWAIFLVEDMVAGMQGSH